MKLRERPVSHAARRREGGGTRYRWRHSRWTRVRALLSTGIICGLGAVATTAAWSQTVTAETGLFTSGQVDLEINGTSPSYTYAPVTNLDPGASRTRSGMLTLQNTGTIDLDYRIDLRARATSVAVTTAGLQHGDAAALARALTLALYTGATSTGTACTGGTRLGDPQPLVADNTPRALLASPRGLDAGASDGVCVELSLAPTAPRESRLAQLGLVFTVTTETR